MPELGEVSHQVSLLRTHLLSKIIKKVDAPPDNLLYVAPLTNSIFVDTLINAKVTDIGRQGKYFWFELNNSKTILMHLGMTGWIYVRNALTHYAPMEQGGDKKLKEWHKELEEQGKSAEDSKFVVTDWIPKYTKFSFETDDGQEFAFSDPRRLGRVRLFDCSSEGVHKFDPINKLGTDFSQLSNSESESLRSIIVPQLLKRKAPLKSVLLDQKVFSGIGNWMADEILFQSHMHPEEKASSLEIDEMNTLYDNIVLVCKTASELEGNTALFPKSWLMLHRWGKSRKGTQTIADGSAIDFVTVGGRTSCYVPDIQKLKSLNKTKSDPSTPDNVKTKELESEEGETVKKEEDRNNEAKSGTSKTKKARKSTKMTKDEDETTSRRIKPEIKELLDSKKFKPS